MDDSIREQIALEAEGTELEKGLSAILSPQDKARAVWKRNIRRAYPAPDRARQAARLLADSRSRVLELLDHADLTGLARELYDVDERCRRLSIPERQPSFAEEFERVWPTLRAANWSPEEARGLEHFWQDGDRFTDIQISLVKFGDRTITRREIRATLHGIPTACAQPIRSPRSRRAKRRRFATNRGTKNAPRSARSQFIEPGETSRAAH